MFKLLNEVITSIHFEFIFFRITSFYFLTKVFQCIFLYTGVLVNEEITVTKLQKQY